MPKKSPPDSWQTIGYVKVHLNDTSGSLYPPATVFTEDPETFEPERDNEGNVEASWGLIKPGNDSAGASLEIFMAEQSSQRMYHDQGCKTPTEQFISILERHKVDSVVSEAVVEACKKSLVLRISLRYCEEDCWRRVRVPAAIELPTFHYQVMCQSWAGREPTMAIFSRIQRMELSLDREQEVILI